MPILPYHNSLSCVNSVNFCGLLVCLCHHLHRQKKERKEKEGKLLSIDERGGLKKKTYKILMKHTISIALKKKKKE